MVKIRLPRYAWFECEKCGEQQLKIRATAKLCSMTLRCKGKLIMTGPAEVAHE